MTEMWTKQEIIDRIVLLNKKYHVGYVDKKPDAATYKLCKILDEMEETGKETIKIQTI